VRQWPPVLDGTYSSADASDSSPAAARTRSRSAWRPASKCSRSRRWSRITTSPRPSGRTNRRATTKPSASPSSSRAATLAKAQTPTVTVQTASPRSCPSPTRVHPSSVEATHWPSRAAPRGRAECAPHGPAQAPRGDGARPPRARRRPDVPRRPGAGDHGGRPVPEGRWPGQHADSDQMRLRAHEKPDRSECDDAACAAHSARPARSGLDADGAWRPRNATPVAGSCAHNRARSRPMPPHPALSASGRESGTSQARAGATPL
jgi:hypothetical protein